MAILNNNPLIGSGGQQGYSINNSLRFRSSASAYLSRTPASAGNRQIWTWSGWVKRGALSSSGAVISCGSYSTNLFQVYFDDSTNKILIQNFPNSTTPNVNLHTSQVFRDPSAWYHIVIAIDTTQATAANRVKMYVNGNQVTSFSTETYPAQNATPNWNTGSLQHNLGARDASTLLFDGYMTDINFIDGQALTPSSFGETDTTTGVWKPKAYSGTYGTNGFYLKFSDIATTSGSNAGLGKDFSGNSNYWTTNNISVTSGTTYDAMTDSPTNTSATVANYPTLNPLSNGGATISNANLTTTANGATHLITNATFQMPTSGKYYWEITTTTLGSTARNGTGLLPNGTALTGYPWGNANAYGWYYGDSSNNIYWNSNTTQPFFISGAVNDVLQICYDADNGTVYAGKNNVFYNSSGSTTGSPSTLTNPTSTGATATNAFFPATSVFTAGAFAINFGQRPFAYTPPTGFVALNTFNLPTSTIVKGNSYFDSTLYTGTGSSQSIVNAGGFSPDFVWVKNRSHNDADPYYGVHLLFNTNAGVGNRLMSQSTASEAFSSQSLTAFNSNGFSIGTDNAINYSGDAYVGWQWRGSDNSAVTNTSGSITSTVSANTTAGFSVVTYTGNGTYPSTIGHGLGVAPKWIITKTRNAVSNWRSYHSVLGAGSFMEGLNNTNAAFSSSTIWNNTSPTSTVFTVGSADTNGNGTTYVAYCWAEIAGFSAFGSYTGNGSTDGPFVYTGFRPKFIMYKKTTTGTGNSHWWIFDSSRNLYNLTNSGLTPDGTYAENSTLPFTDFLSNGFKLRTDNGENNDNGQPYIYMAFAENPFKNSLAR